MVCLDRLSLVGLRLGIHVALTIKLTVQRVKNKDVRITSYSVQKETPIKCDPLVYKALPFPMSANFSKFYKINPRSPHPALGA